MQSLLSDVGESARGSGRSDTAAAAASSDALLLAKLGVGDTFQRGDGRWVQKRVKTEFWDHHHGDMCPVSVVNCYRLMVDCPHCTAHRVEEPKPYREGYCSPYYCVCRQQEPFLFAQRCCLDGRKLSTALKIAAKFQSSIAKKAETQNFRVFIIIN